MQDFLQVLADQKGNTLPSLADRTSNPLLGRRFPRYNEKLFHRVLRPATSDFGLRFTLPVPSQLALSLATLCIFIIIIIIFPLSLYTSLSLLLLSPYTFWLLTASTAQSNMTTWIYDFNIEFEIKSSFQRFQRPQFFCPIKILNDSIGQSSITKP